MPSLRIKIQVNGRPLRRAYVEQATTVGFAATEWHMTDNDGKVRDKNGDWSVNSWTTTTDLRIHAANSVVRVLDGQTSNIAVHQDKSGVRDGDTININTDREQKPWFAIANRCLLAYEWVYRQFSPFVVHGDFPLGKKPTFKETYDQSRRIEVSFPSHMPFAKLAFNEPHSLSTGYPLIHIIDGDRRLFGRDADPNNRDDVPSPPTLIPAELSHALHFSLFSDSERGRLQNDYLQYLTSAAASGGSTGHTLAQSTAPQVAYLEALDHFGNRFYEYVRRKVLLETTNAAPPPLPRRGQLDDTVRRNFVAAELGGAEEVFPRAGLVCRNGSPLLQTDSVEGAVYGAIFVDFANRTSLRTAVESYLASATVGVDTFGRFRTWIRNNTRHGQAIDQVSDTWGM